ncbi:hypothetical protein [Streptomyces sp. GESEQ-35]|uniref:hypothetical protein n=1 Tax=Streptomyces sp. GESEQ-35 TaxID=2812657 RepID=UPI001FF2C927|nr:hypothetical protein [Streptomyces sp. GESEQ-35]
MKVLLALLVMGVLIAAPFLLWSYVPFQSWARARMRAVKREVRPRRRWLALRHAEPLLREGQEVLPPVLAGRSVAGGQRLTPEWMVRWWYAAQISLPISAVLFVLFAYLAWNAQAIFNWRPPPTDESPHPQSPVDNLREKATALVDVVQSWDWPEDAFLGVRFLILAVVAAGLIPLLIRVVAVIAQRPEHRERRAKNKQRKWGDRAHDDFSLCWPVVALVLTAVKCGREFEKLDSEEAGDDVPKISLSAVERVLWRAPRVRRGKARAHQDRATADHIGRVVGALREAEARQDSHPKQALQDMAVMLLTIAERYAEGKVSHLLDDEQIGDAPKVVHREGLRLLALGGVVVSAMAGAALAGLPDAALTALLPLVVIIVGILLYREKGPTPAQLRDLVIPR